MSARATALRIDAAGLHYRELNQRIRKAVAEGATRIDLLNVNGQRYIADGLTGPVEIDIRGVPGNDLGAFMAGPTVRVHGNAQDAVGNTMGSGRIYVDGHAGDVLGYGMRGGEVFVRGDVGYRVGIHMKAFRDRFPVLVVGGAAGDFLAEYMAGGLLIVLGLDLRPGTPLVGDWCATGMHGGEIYLRGDVDPVRVAEFALARPATEAEVAALQPRLAAFGEAFSIPAQQLSDGPWTRIAPMSHRPYGAKYAV